MRSQQLQRGANNATHRILFIGKEGACTDLAIRFAVKNQGLGNS